MARIGVVHTDLSAMGGAESVCMHVLEALQTEHDITLITSSAPDYSELNEFFNTDVTRTSIEFPSVVGVDLSRFIRSLERLLGTGQMVKLELAVLNRYAQRMQNDFDLILATRGAFPSQSSNVIQYVHFPLFGSEGIDTHNHTVSNSSHFNHVFDAAVRVISGVSTGASNIDNSKYVVNSDWTGSVVSDAYHVSSESIFPPVSVDQYRIKSKERQDGFVTIGRIDKDKKLNRCIDIIDRLRRKNYMVELHIAGPPYDEEYANELKDRVNGLDFVHMHGRVSSHELADLISSNKYGLHSKEFEHFGIVVAEMIAGGMIPFVHNSGGVKEIVGHDNRLAYTDTAEAVENISSVLSDKVTQEEIKTQLPDPKERFGRQRFSREVRILVENVLNES